MRANRAEVCMKYFANFCEEGEETSRKTIQIDGLRCGGITRVVDRKVCRFVSQASPPNRPNIDLLQCVLSSGLFRSKVFRSKESTIRSKILLCCIILPNVLFRPFDEVNEVYACLVQTSIRCKIPMYGWCLWVQGFPFDWVFHSSHSQIFEKRHNTPGLPMFACCRHSSHRLMIDRH